MKKICTIFILMSAFFHMYAKSPWQKTLDNVKVPEYFQKATMQLYFKYLEPVDGHTVTAKWFPFDSLCETGYAVIRFYNLSTHRSYYYISDKDWFYNNYDLDKISLSDDFTGHVNDTTYEFHYIKPTDPINTKYSGYSKLHPLGYYTPYQVMDIDFDGKKEVLVNEWDLSKGGNLFHVFEIEGEKLIENEKLPFNYLTNESYIYIDRKAISISLEDGVYDWARFYFSLKRQNAPLLKYPKFKTLSAQWMLESAETDGRFQLDSILESSNDTAYRYVGEPVIR